jgi:hypothetical protein
MHHLSKAEQNHGFRAQTALPAPDFGATILTNFTISGIFPIVPTNTFTILNNINLLPTLTPKLRLDSRAVSPDFHMSGRDPLSIPTISF